MPPEACVPGAHHALVEATRVSPQGRRVPVWQTEGSILGGLHSLVNPSISRISRNHPTAVGFRSFVTWWGMNDFFQGNSGTFSLVGFELEDGNRGFAWLCRHFLAMDVTHWDHGVGRVTMAQIVAHCTYFMARAHFSV